MKMAEPQRLFERALDARMTLVSGSFRPVPGMFTESDKATEIFQQCAEKLCNLFKVRGSKKKKINPNPNPPHSKDSPCDPGMAIATFDWLDVARNSAVNAVLMPYVLEQGEPLRPRMKRIKASSSSNGKSKEEEDGDEDDNDDDDDDYPDFVPEDEGEEEDHGFQRVPPQAVKRPRSDGGGKKKFKISLKSEKLKQQQQRRKK